MARRVSLGPPPVGVGVPRRRRRRRRISRRALWWIGGGAAGVVLLPVAAIFILFAMIDPNAYKTQIEAAVQQSFGRELRINGPIILQPSLSPELVVNDLTLSNIPGGSRADMVRVEQADVELSLRALLGGRFVIARMSLLRPDILLETTASGEDNWRFDRPVRGPAGAAASPSSAAALPRLSLQTLHIRDGSVTWRDRRTGRSLVFDVRRVSATAANADSPVSLGAEVVIGRQHVTLMAQTGPLARLADASAQAPWGLFANFESGSAKLTVTGSLTRPLEGHGYSLRVDGDVPDLSELSWLSPIRLPALHNLTFTARLLDQGGTLPDISQVSVKAGLTNLDQISPGFTLDTARIDMPRLTEPAVITAEGNFAGSELSLNGTVGPLSLLLPGARAGDPLSVDVTAEAGGATFGVRGVIAAPTTQSGMNLAIGARVPDLSILSPLVGQRLPPLKTIAFSGQLVDVQGGGQGGTGGYANGATLKDVVLTLPQGDLAGDITLRLGNGGAARPALLAVLKSGRLDLDGLLAALSSNGGADLDGLMPAPGAAASSLDVTAPLPVPQRSLTLIPDTDLPLALLDIGDADAQASVGELDIGGNVVRNLVAHVVLKDGRLLLDPITGDLPGGQLRLRLDMDSRQAVPPVSLQALLPGVDVGKLLDRLGRAGAISGSAALDADLHAAGRSLHAMATSLNGYIGVALTGGDVDTGLLGTVLASMLQIPPPPPSESGAMDRTAIRCIAARLDVAQGIGTLGPAVFDSNRVLFNVAGKVNLADETLALQLRTTLLANGVATTVPVRLDGGFKDARLSLAGKPDAVPVDAGDACGPALAAMHGQTGSGQPAAAMRRMNP